MILGKIFSFFGSLFLKMGFFTTSLPDTLPALPVSEACLAALCVAAVFGFLGSSIFGKFFPKINFLSIFVGTLAAWAVCKYELPYAHAWFETNPRSHMVYDFVSLFGAYIGTKMNKK